MVPLAVREAFESALVNALHQRYFGENSGAMLLAAAECYHWNLGDSKRLLDAGAAGWHLSRLLDDLSLLFEVQIQQYLLLTEPPQPKLAFHARAQAHEFSTKAPNAFAYVCPPEQMQRWLQARHRAPLLQHIKNYAHQRYQASALIRGIAKFALFPAVIALAIVIMGFFQNKEALIIAPPCDQAYAQAIQQNWKGIYGEAIQVMRSCAIQRPLLMCSDRENLSKVASMQERLTPHDTFPYLSSSLLFNMSDGREFALSPVANCTSHIRILRESHWRQSGDIAAVRQAIGEVANCPIDENDSVDSNFLSLLKHTDAWPPAAVKSKSQSATIPLTALMLPPIDIDPTKVIAPPIAWARCETDQGMALTLTTSQVGPNERNALQGREAKRLLQLLDNK